VATQPITLDYSLAMQSGLSSPAGLSDSEVEAQLEPTSQAVRSVLAKADGGELGFFALPSQRDTLTEIDSVASRLPSGFTDVLVLGIGGSSLGTRAVLEALRPPAIAGRALLAGGPAVHLPDNSDPWIFAHLLEALDPSKTVVLVISKSGGTVETAAQMIIAQEWLVKAVGKDGARARIVAITDPKSGTLRALATAEGWATLPIPSNVGGRFCALTAVGLLPARLCGLDTAGMLSGAAAMAERCRSLRANDNPAAMIALLSWLHDRERGHSIHVMMPYSDRLKSLAAWYVQLWAESLGKRVDRAGHTVECGPTPLPAVGATDQHAQVQLFMEGPRNKLVTFIGVTQHERDLKVPASEGANAYLSGASLAQLLEAERLGTTEALAADGRPSLTLLLQRIDAGTVGGLLFLYEAATAFSGELYGINAFDQPGVELGKKLAFGLLGRAGYEAAAEQIRAAQRARPGRYRS
jgi:glucose-6-phosphate isomerase